ncbi:NACHT, LRR and PYD domains-containing protein 12-like isoform X3 [Neoarius graeffei]|uniref:NACHT, LRR and PYD domains-containing protein 12-like isoform X3 n=1 Tax=Neoarius graeffei TaxID=443677 RepID=UPI00298C7E6B|nr:NACHT, LRR and PYD domains-containing protein 12-like isoform X3 [Neoarius graeffei]
MESRDLDTDNVTPPSEKRKLQMKRSDSPEPSCVSMKSDWSIDLPLRFNTGNPSSVHSKLQMKRSDSPEPSCVSMKSDGSMDPPLHFNSGNPSSVHSVLQKAGDRREKIFITDTGHAPESAAGNDVRKKFRLNLMKKFQCLNEVMIKQENRVLLNEIYTELYITEGDSGDVNKEHEVRQIEAASRRKTTEETQIKCNDIFKPLSEEDEPIRTVVTKGVAGIGKTVSVQKFIVDWAEGKANQDVPLIFPLPFRELNLMEDQNLRLMELLHVYFKETKETEMSGLGKVLFIFDGLDECRFPLDFQNTVRVCDVTESASVHVLLINLIKGNLLPSALIWITSRPAAADQIPSEYVHRVTEVRGFNDPQKEEYFRKRVSDQSLAENIITHLKSLRSLYIMCHIPVFCWISAAVLERMLSEAESGEIPKTLTQMYTHFLIIQTNIIRGKYSKKQESDEEMLLKLGKLAFQQLEKGNLIFYEEDLRECGIDVAEAAVYSGVCTQIFREEVGLHQSKVYCFVHLSVQEHLAALYVHLTFMKEKRNVLDQSQSSNLYFWSFKTISDVHRSAVDQTLKSQTGHLDLFLRFLLGLSLKSNQKLLRALVTQTGSSSWTGKRKTVQYIKEKISENLPAEKSINLFHCLNELGDDSLVEEIQRYVKSGKQSELSPSQWSALVFVLLTSAQELEEFDLSKYTRTEKIPEWVLVKVMPVISASRKAMISCDTIKGRSAEALVSVLNSETSSLRELHLTVKTLDLTNNKLEDSGVKCLCAVLENPHSKVETLKLCDCGVSDEGCAALSSALRSNPSHLRELDLTNNNLGDSGVKRLCAVLENPHCELETLGISCDTIKGRSAEALVSVLNSETSSLRELHLTVKTLDLTNNKLEDSGVKRLCAVLENPHSKVETLGLWHCGVSDEGCAALSSALRSNPSHLRQLDLSFNNLGDSGVKRLCAVLENPHCKVETLKLRGCGVSDEGCAALSSALRSNPSHLRELDLTNNNLGDSGVKCLCTVLENPHCKLETLGLWGCGVSDKGCAALSSALRSNPSHLRELDLTNNNLGDSGVKRLCAVLENPHCKLEKLRWWLFKDPSVLAGRVWACEDTPPHQSVHSDCESPSEAQRSLWIQLVSCDTIKGRSAEALVSVLNSKTSSLRELRLTVKTLDLTNNKLEDSGVKRLCAVLENPHCKVETLRLCDCGVSDEGCAALSSALRSNPSHLRQLDLSKNNLGDSGVKRLCAVLENLHCKLETLKLCDCGVSDEGCAALSSALRSNPSHLRELDLTNNNLGDSGVKRLCAVLENPHCEVETLKLCDCGVSDEGCAALSSALRSNPSHLRQLDLSKNNLGDSGVKRLCAVLENPHCKLETLKLRGCSVSDEGCAALSSALRSNPSHLRELNLSNNNLGDSGVKRLCAVLENPHCKLETLGLCGCGVSDEGCAALSSALRSNPSHLRQLDLTNNNLGDSGVKRLCAVLENPHCKLEILGLWHCGVSDEGCAALASALRSNPSHLRGLGLIGNKIEDSGKKLLSALKDDKHYKLQTLWV